MGSAGSGPVTVALVEDDDEARKRLVASINADPSLKLVGEFATGAAALAAFSSGAPDVYLVDLGLPDMPGLQIVKRVADRFPACGRFAGGQGHARYIDVAAGRRATARSAWNRRRERAAPGSRDIAVARPDLESRRTRAKGSRIGKGF